MGGRLKSRRAAADSPGIVNRRPALALPLLALAAGLLAGCDMLGIESPAVQAARKEAEGKAIGSACRHAGRAIEDCYLLNKKAEKAAVFAGWKEMNDYMRENKIEEVAPQIRPEVKVATAKPADDAEPEDKPAAKSQGKH